MLHRGASERWRWEGSFQFRDELRNRYFHFEAQLKSARRWTYILDRQEELEDALWACSKYLTCVPALQARAIKDAAISVRSNAEALSDDWRARLEMMENLAASVEGELEAFERFFTTRPFWSGNRPDRADHLTRAHHLLSHGAEIANEFDAHVHPLRIFGPLEEAMLFAAAERLYWADRIRIASSGSGCYSNGC